MTLRTNDEAKKGAPKGTPLYEAPELFDGLEYNSSADVYSFGLTLWTFYTCETLPWLQQFTDVNDFWDAISDGMRPELDDKCPKRLADLMMKCWQHDAKARPTMESVATELAHILVDISLSDPNGAKLWHEIIESAPSIVGYTLSQGHYEHIPFHEFWRRFKQLCPESLEFNKTSKLVAATLLCEPALTKASPDITDEHTVGIENFGRMLKWFGPCDENLPRRMEEVLSQHYFYGMVSGEDAIRLLSPAFGKEPVYNSFLVRFSATNPGAYTISTVRPASDSGQVRKGKNGKPEYVNRRIQYNPDAPKPFAMPDIDQNRSFRTMRELFVSLGKDIECVHSLQGSPYRWLFSSAEEPSAEFVSGYISGL